MLKRILPFLLLLLILTSQLSAQKSTPRDYYKDRRYSSKPSIELSYGLSDIKFNGNTSNFADVGLLELKLGFTSQRISTFSKNVLRYRNGYLFLSNISSDLSARSNSTGIKTNLWRFGLGSKEGYGIKMGAISLMPYNSNSFLWSRFTYDKMNEIPDITSLDKFENTFRFGSSTEAGINIQLVPGFSIEPKYELQTYIQDTCSANNLQVP